MLNELSTFPPFSKKTGWEEVMDETKAVGDKTTSQEAKVMESRCQLYIFGHCILDRQSFGCFALPDVLSVFDRLASRLRPG